LKRYKKPLEKDRKRKEKLMKRVEKGIENDVNYVKLISNRRKNNKNDRKIFQSIEI
jgi:hypothetical protein